jgi:hypothetical protein
MLEARPRQVAHFEYPVRKPRKKKQRDAAVTTSVASPRLSDRLPIIFSWLIFKRLSSLSLATGVSI